MCYVFDFDGGRGETTAASSIVGSSTSRLAVVTTRSAGGAGGVPLWIDGDDGNVVLQGVVELCYCEGLLHAEHLTARCHR
jgi:hypothetical protein